jgi:EAL domain-containing protein (putative c-di-GMP-specific phosphodiesterase class I)
VLIPAIDKDHDPEDIARKLLTAMQSPFTGLAVTGDLFLSISIGIAQSRPEAEKPDSLLRRAGDAMYSAKKSGRGRSVHHTIGMTDDAGRRLAIESDIRGAAERGEFSLHYQPILSLKTLTVAKVEALLRWNHPTFGQVPPNEFIPVAEASNQIVPVGTWVLREACRQLAIWGDGAPSISVNFSASQFRESDLAESIASELRCRHIDPSRLQVEITETVLIDDVEIIIGTLHQLRDIGIHVTIDDFGTGYSSLRYLRDLPVDAIKVDRSFISGLESDAGALAIVEGITSLAHAIGLTVTAEGIETAEQLHRLREMGCDFGQGFHLARPTPAGASPPGLALAITA